MDEAEILQRFDHAPLGKFHLTLLLVSGSCWAWVAYGVAIIGFLIPSLQAEWHVSASALGFLAGTGMLGMVGGSVLSGALTDRFGRRRMLTIITYFLGLMFIFSGLAWNYSVLLILRFLTGMGMGAMLPAAATLISEFSPARYRGAMLVLQNGFWGLGGSLAALVGYEVVLRAGWRPAMFFGGLAIFSALIIPRLLPESLRFLFSKGQVERAQAEAARIHLGNSKDTPCPPENIVPKFPPAAANDGIWSQRYARITFSLWFLWFSLNFLYQGVFIWLPTLLAGGSSSIQRSFLMTLIISLGQFPGTVLVAYLADRGSRRKIINVSLIMLSVSTVLFSLGSSTAWVLTTGFILMVFNGMAWGLANPFSSELYPTRMRATATGWAAGFGRLGGVVAPLVVAWVMQAGGGMTAIFTILAAAPAVTTLVLTGLKQETTGRSLEDICAD